MSAAEGSPTRRIVKGERLLDCGITSSTLRAAWAGTDEFLLSLPITFGLAPVELYTALNLRNLSGLIGEIFKYSIHRKAPDLEPNPHPDGRPDLLDLRQKAARRYFQEKCLQPSTGAPIRSRLTPFRYGGIEVKCTLGNYRSSALVAMGQSRVEYVTGITYWAHHRHKCLLLGLYYDFDQAQGGSPQVKAIFLFHVNASDWAVVSIGKAEKKKTSNTSLLKPGRDALKRGLVAYDSSDVYRRMLTRVGVVV